MRALLFCFILTFCFGCQDNNSKSEKTATKSSSSGNINSLNVVMEAKDWNGAIGENIRSVFAAEVDGLPQVEPLFNLNHLPTETFSGFAKKNRIFIQVENNKQQGYKILDNPYAKPQKGILIHGQNPKEIAEVLEEKGDDFILELKKTELAEKSRRIRKSTKSPQPLIDHFGVSLNFPSAYRYAKEEKDFIWMRKDIPKGNLELLVYEVPIHLVENENEPIVNLIKIRDSIGKKHIPGPREGQFMITEEAYMPFIKSINFKGKNAYEVKGTWEVEGAFMAGPFLLYAIKDEVNQRYLIAEGFVFRPSKSKRDQIFEIEAILKSLKFEN